MHDKGLYARILNIEDPWRVPEVELNEQAEEATMAAVAEHNGAELS
ncbi:MAG: hypothetical protein OXJ90_25050 [Spirochaetaceae bacterium]|nr:hypothetical protein [Spirochaetaceae bacterium]